MSKTDPRDEIFYMIPVTAHGVVNITQSQLDEHRREFGRKVTPRQFVEESYVDQDIGGEDIPIVAAEFHWSGMAILGPDRKPPIRTKLMAGSR